jgi:hypothetical protein
MTLRTSDGKARNGVNSDQCARHSLTIAGYRDSQFPAKASSAAASSAGGVDQLQILGERAQYRFEA